MNVYQQRLRAVRLSTADKAAKAWDALEEHNRADAEPFAQRIIPVVNTGQLVTAKTTAAYLRRKGTTPPRIRLSDVTGLRRGVDPVEVYQRPFGAVWHALGQGKPLPEALAQGRSRLTDLVRTDVILAMKAAAEIVGAADNNLTGWVRVADATACDLCSAADGETYSSASDMGIHPGCGCTLDPLFGTDSQPADDSATTTHESDETGPLLYEAGHSFAS